MAKTLKRTQGITDRYALGVQEKKPDLKLIVSSAPTIQEAPESAVLSLFGMPVESVLSAEELEAYDERAGIMEHEAHLDKTEAEGRAVAEIVSTRDPIPIDLSAFDCIEIKGDLYDSFPKFSDRDENGITRLPNRPCQKIIRETVPPWDRLPRAGNAGW